MKLILVRHGQTDWNTCRRVQGRTDVSLNAKGILQAKAAADYLKNRGIRSIYSGPLARAYDTAEEIAAEAHVARVSVMDGLTEINFGEWEGKTDEELKLHFPQHWGDWNWVLHPELCREIGAESAAEILERTLGCISAIMSENPQDAAIAIVSHTMPIKLITAHFIGLPVSRIRGIRADNCSTSVIELQEDGQASLICWNDTSYLGGLL